ncbi:MAG: phospholipase A [Gammaproteobacteria bacterium]|nr:phospholipase A [Gammaproteobacteria bacterium]
MDDNPLSEQQDPKETDASSKVRRWFGIRPYHKNYVLPVTYNSRAQDNPLVGAEGGLRPENLEVKFQLSFELPVWRDVLVDDLDFYVAYTQLSFFQAYNTQYSSPFRDTAYEPEAGFNWQPDLAWFDWSLESLRIALNHQSNGRTEPLSRSWNRVIGQVEVKRDDLELGLRVWTRINESSTDDDNPDIVDFLGHGEVFAGYEWGSQRYGLMFRNLFEHPAVQLDWSYLLTDNVRLYVQYFNGYGESLIDYNRKVNRIGVGFMLDAWP